MTYDTYLPAFPQNNIPIVFSSNNLYIPYVATVIQSIMDNSKSENGYDIFIMHRDINKSNQKLLTDFTHSWSNCSVRFIDMVPYIDDSSFFVGNRLTIETYFRIFMPEILSNYKKAIYLDVDIIVCADLADLFNEDINGYLLAATRDCWLVGLCHMNDNDRRQYTYEILQLKNCNDYFQAGVLVFNLEEFRKQLSVSYIMNTVKSYNWRHHDQDVLNVLCDGQVKYIDQAWDIVCENKRLAISDVVGWCPQEIASSYFCGKESPKIVHYAASEKPWNTPWIDFFELFWKCARKTPYYEIILCRMMDSKDNALQKRISRVNRELPIRDQALQLFERGEIGFKYIFKYIRAWLHFKLKGKR